MSETNTARLLISCPDRPGIVAAVSQFLYSHGANILDAQQHSTDPSSGEFLMRMVFHLEDLDVTRAQFERAFAEVVARPPWLYKNCDTAALREYGLKVPEDVSVVGFDDIPEASFFEPPLTTVRQDFIAMGQQTVDYLLALIQQPETPYHQRMLYPRLIERSSTARPPS